MVRHGRALYKQEPVWVTCVEFSGIHKASPHMLFEKASLKALSQVRSQAVLDAVERVFLHESGAYMNI